MKSKRLPARCLVCGAMYTVTRKTFNYGTPREYQVYECDECGDYQSVGAWSLFLELEEPVVTRHGYIAWQL